LPLVVVIAVRSTHFMLHLPQRDAMMNQLIAGPIQYQVLISRIRPRAHSNVCRSRRCWCWCWWWRWTLMMMMISNSVDDNRWWWWWRMMMMMTMVLQWNTAFCCCWLLSATDAIKSNVKSNDVWSNRWRGASFNLWRREHSWQAMRVGVEDIHSEPVCK